MRGNKGGGVSTGGAISAVSGVSERRERGQRRGRCERRDGRVRGEHEQCAVSEGRESFCVGGGRAQKEERNVYSADQA